MRLRLVLLSLVLALVGAACGGGSTEPVPRPEGATATTAAPFVDNEFIPEDANIGDCVSSLPRPECGSESRGGYQELATFGFLLAGTAFIAWRIARSVRRRDADVNAGA